MKTITFICLIIFFTSCKKDLQFDFGGGNPRATGILIQTDYRQSGLRAIERDGSLGVGENCDDGAMISVRVTVDGKARSATVDFTGTSDQRPTNFNAPRSVTTAAVRNK